MKSASAILNFLLYDFIKQINDQIFPVDAKPKKKVKKKSFPIWRLTPSASINSPNIINCSPRKKARSQEVITPPITRIKCGKIEDEPPRSVEASPRRLLKPKMARINTNVPKENRQTSTGPNERRAKSARAAPQSSASKKDLRQKNPSSANEAKRKEACQEHFNHWLQEKLKQESEIKKKRKMEEREVDRIKKEKEVVRCQLNELMKEEWLRRKEAERKEEVEKKKREQEMIETEKKMKEMISKVKVDKWMENAQKKPGPVDQNIFSFQKTHISFYNPDPWKQILEDDGKNLNGKF